MGSGIAGSILRAGHDVVVWNRTRAKCAELEAAGARVAGSIADACEGREVVCTMLADDASLEEVALGPGGIRESLPTGAIHMVMGTHGVGVVQKLTPAHAEAGQTLVASPVLGRPDMAASGQLGIVAAGPAAAVDRCEPLFDAAGRRTFRAGEVPESATAIKLANNFVLGCAIEAMGEGFSLVRKYDVEPGVFQEVMTEGLFAAPAYSVYGGIIVEERYDPAGFTVELALKDTDLMLDAAERGRLPLPSLNVYRDRLLTAMATGDDQKDWAIMARVQAQAGGLD